MNYGTPEEVYNDYEEQHPNENKNFGCFILILLIILIIIIVHNENS